MKKYKLLKDLPLAKAGTICIIDKERARAGGPSSDVVRRLDNPVIEEIIMGGYELGEIQRTGKFDEWFEEIKESKVWKPEEDEEYWYTYGNGDFESDAYPDEYDNEYSQSMAKSRVEIGNCFKTEEEAEKAVEKLKALRRLREAGFKFTSWRWKPGYEEADITVKMPTIDKEIANRIQVEKDMKLLFGEERL